MAAAVRHPSRKRRRMKSAWASSPRGPRRPGFRSGHLSDDTYRATVPKCRRNVRAVSRRGAPSRCICRTRSKTCWRGRGSARRAAVRCPGRVAGGEVAAAGRSAAGGSARIAPATPARCRNRRSRASRRSASRCQRSATWVASGAASRAACAYAVARSRLITSTPAWDRSQPASAADSRSGRRSITRRRSRSTRMVP
jgi:hypothetical protein